MKSQQEGDEMQILRQYQISGKTAFIALIDNPSVPYISEEAEKMNTRLATSEELTKLHMELWLTEHGSECEIEQTIALGNKHSSGDYTFVSIGLFDCVLTGITEDRIRAGHKVLLIAK